MIILITLGYLLVTLFHFRLIANIILGVDKTNKNNFLRPHLRIVITLFCIRVTTNTRYYFGRYY